MKVIEFIKTHDYSKMTSLEVADLLKANGYNNSQGLDYSALEVDDLLWPLFQVNKSYSKKGFGGCGIDRDKNPCGDASDY